MNTQVLEKIKSQKIGRMPVVVVPLKIWEEVAQRLEDFEMLHSLSLRKKIVGARKEKKLYSDAQVKKILRLR